jgi:outer membrane protein TolC
LLVALLSMEVKGAILKYEDLPSLIHQKNGAVEAAGQSIQAAESRTGHYTRSLLPHFDAFGGAEHFRTGPFPTETQPYGGVELSLNVFRGGKDRLEEDHRKAQLSGARAEKDKVVREELAQIRNYYWELVFEREWLTSLRQMLKRTEDGAKAASRRKTRGLISDTDVLSFELYGQQLKEQIASAEHEIELIQIAIRPRLGWDDKAPVETPAVIPHDHDEVLLKAEATGHPQIESLTARAESAGALARQNSRWWLPSVEVYGNYSLYTLRERFYPQLNDRFDIALGVRLKMHLFDGFEGSQEAESGFRSALAAETLAGYRKATLKADVKLAQEEMLHVHELIHGAETFIEKGKKILSQSLSEYDRGVRTTQDVLGVTDRMLSFQKLYLERRRDYQKSKVKLLSLLGR